MLYDLDTLDSTTHPHAARAISAIDDAQEFLDLYQDADAVGRARLLDASTHPAGPARGCAASRERLLSPPLAVSSSSSTPLQTTPLR
jgi:hypothetical protein